MDAEWIAIGAETDFPEGLKAIEAGGRRLVMCKIEGRLFATSATCPHAGVPMEKSEIEGTLLTCPIHGWRFDVACEGREIHGYRGLEMTPVRVREGVVYIAVNSGHACEEA